MNLVYKNSPSQLLGKSENDSFFENYKQGTKSTATAIVELYCTNSPDHNKYEYFCTGVACLTRDSNRKSYFIQIFRFENRTLKWEQELYNDFVFRMVSTTFLEFEADGCMAGLNFASESEAKIFIKALNIRIERRAKSLEPKTTSVPTQSKRLFNDFKSIVKRIANKPEEKKAKFVIGAPEGFVHVNHVGTDSTDDVNAALSDDTWKTFFTAFNVSTNLLNSEAAKKQIKEMVDECGGIESVLNQIQVTKNNEKEAEIIRQDSDPDLDYPEPKSGSLDPIDEKNELSSLPPPPPLCAPESPKLPERKNSTNESNLETSVPKTINQTSFNLTDAIQKGVALKKLDQNAIKSQSTQAALDSNPMLAHLQNRLNAMRLDVADENVSDNSGEESDSWDE